MRVVMGNINHHAEGDGTHHKVHGVQATLAGEVMGVGGVRDVGAVISSGGQLVYGTFHREVVRCRRVVDRESSAAVGVAAGSGEVSSFTGMLRGPAPARGICS